MSAARAGASGSKPGSDRPKPVTRAYWELIKPISVMSKAQLFIEIACSYARVRWLLRRHEIRAVVATLRDVPADRREISDDALADKYAGYRLGRAVARTLGVLPGDSRCLVRSLVLTQLLARREIPSSFVIGISSESEFAPHAWVESDGVPLLSPENATDRRLLEI
jgi:transglutaminase superfamily protein